MLAPRPRSTSLVSLARALGALLALTGVLTLKAPPAAAQYLFGQNKVNYTGRDWKIFSTPRLDVYYYEGEEDLAAWLADFAEKTCEEYETYFRHKFENKIPLILYASHHDFKQTNIIDMLISDYVGGFTEFLRGRVAIPHTGSMTLLRNVTRHELVHAFMNDKLARVMSERRKFNLPPPPLWFSEGMAEYIATWRPDTEAQMFMRDLVVNDNLVEMPELWRIHGTFLMYKEGESLVGYMATRFGDDVIPRMLENWWRADAFETVLFETVGISAEELNRDWKRFLKRRYAPAVMASEWPEQHGTALTRGPGLHTRPAVIDSTGQDGACDFVFIGTGSGTLDLVRARALETSQVARGDVPYAYETLVRSGRSTRFESLPAFASGPEAHGDRIAFTCKSGEKDALVVYDATRREEIRRFHFEKLIALASPTWSPDGEQIAFTALDRSGWSDVYRVELATGELDRLTRDSADDRDPDWSRDGTRIAWSSDRDYQHENGVYHIWTLDLATGTTVQLTSGAHEHTAPSWGPDDASILFGSDADGANNIYLYEFEDEVLTQVSFALGGLFTPQWTPDGQGYLATSFDNTSFNIFRFGFDRRREAPQEGELEPRVALASSEAGRIGSDAGTDAGVDWLARSAGARYPSEDYKTKFGLDYVRTAVALDPNFASAAGATLGFTDMLGNHQLAIFASNASDSFRDVWRHLNVGLTYTNRSHRLHWSTGVFHLTSTYDARIDRYRYERRAGGLFGLSYPLSRFQRVETSMVARFAQMDGEDARVLGVGEEAVLLSNYTSFVHDNTMWSFTGPVEGTRLNVTLGHTLDLTNAKRDGSSAQLDARRYWRMPGRSVFAGRVAARGSWGNDVQYFYLGGPFDLRGYRLRSLFSRHTALANAEFRFPLLDRLLLGLPFHNLEFGGFRGALFTDAAYLGFPYSSWYGSVGVGFEMWLMPGFVARFDVGRTHDFDRMSNENFTHFFLGWDY